MEAWRGSIKCELAGIILDAQALVHITSSLVVAARTSNKSPALSRTRRSTSTMTENTSTLLPDEAEFWLFGYG